MKQVLRVLLHPFRTPVTWACQRGLLTPAIARVLPWRWATEPFTIYGTGWTCRWFPTEFDGIGHRIFWTGMRKWEKETSPVILQCVRTARCFLDIGANCGIYTVIGCTLNPDLRVVAFEPAPRTFAALKNNVEGNHFSSRVTLLNMALGTENGVVPFHEAEDSTMSSLATEGYQGTKGRVTQVECRTVDSVVEELGIKPDFLKIDVEGFEHLVLEGTRQTLMRFRPTIVLEANPGDPADRVAAILSDFGYEFRLITDAGPLRRDTITPDQVFRNWLCVPDSTPGPKA